ncbi:MAG: hypothetical protein KAX36_06290, partial [Thermoflexales bacterium]|nr:hypothetical protein [Thermoflexales bacterium]
EFVLLRIRADIMDFVNCHSSVIRHCSAGISAFNRRTGEREGNSDSPVLPFSCKRKMKRDG